MVQTPLVTPDVNWGKTILSALDAAKFPITAAFWFLGGDDKWELAIATPLYEKLGQRGAYLELIEALRPTGNFFLGDLPLRLESNKRPLIKALRKSFGNRPDVEGRRLEWQPVGGVFVRDAILYRVEP